MGDSACKLHDELLALPRPGIASSWCYHESLGRELSGYLLDRWGTQDYLNLEP
jgi:hypothetical protein